MSDAMVRVFDVENEALDFKLLMEGDGYTTKAVSTPMQSVRLRYESGNNKTVEATITGDGSNFVVMAWRT